MKTSGRSRHGVFISYARADGENAARELQARLEADAPDIAAWLDRYEIEGGVGWWTQIEEALDRAEFLVLVMTPAAMRSDNTRREWRSARQRGVCVYPIKGCPDDELDFASLPVWMRKAHFYDPQLEWPKLIAHLRRGCTATRVPFMAPPLSAGFVARGQQSHIVRELLNDRTAGDRTIALRGAGGFGKTTLATAICHDERIIDGFDDGVLWVTLGQSPNLLIELVKLYAALTGERPGFVDVEDAARELSLKLENRNCLLVIDDAWSVAHVRPFLIGAPGCARLITTRLHDLTGGMTRIEIEQMSSAEAVELLISRAGVTPQDLAPFRAVTERLGEWPLVIKLAGSTMRQRIERGDTVENALDYVRRALDKRGIAAFDSQDPSDRSGAVGLTVAASLDLLDDRDRRRCIELAIFPEDAAIALGTAARVWQLDDLDSEDLAHKLDDLALIDFDLQRDRLLIHDVLRSYLLKMLPDPPAVHQRLLDAWGDPYRLPDVDAWRGYAYHMVRAGRGDALKALLLDFRWLDAKLRATHIGSLIGDFEYVAGDVSVDLVRDALRLSAPALANDPRQLRTQLLGRLLSRREPDLLSMQERSALFAAGPWLRLIHPSLDAPGGMLMMTLVGHTREVTSLAMDSDSRMLISGSEDGTVRVWELPNGQLLRTFEHRRLGVRAVATSSDGRIVLSGGADGMLYLWDTDRGELLSRFSGEARRARTAVALSADGAVAVCGSRERSLTLCDLGPLLKPAANATASPTAALRTLSGHDESVTSVALSADGRLAVSGSDDGTMRVWDTQSGALQRTLTGDSGAVNAVALSADGRVALSGSGNRTIALWNLEDGTCVRTLSGHDASVTALATGNGRAISGSSDQRACLWSLETGALLAKLDGHSDKVTAVAIDAGGTIGATASIDRSIKVWRLDNIRAVDASNAHAGAVVSLLFNADGRMCASGAGDGRIKIRDVASGRVLRTIETNSALVRSLAFTADGSCVLSVGVDDQAWLWTVEEGPSTWIPVRHTAPIDYCTLSAMARYMVSACSDRFVYLWDVPSGGLIEKYSTRRLFDHLIEPSPRRKERADSDDLRDEYLPGESIFQVLVARTSDDGSRIILSAFVPDAGGIRTQPRQERSEGGALLVFDPRSGALNTVRTPQAERVSAVAVDAAGKRLLWARANHQLELWDLETEECTSTLRGHTEKVNVAAFTPDGSYAISCSRDRSFRVWNPATGECVASFIADAALRSLAVAPDGTFAVGDVAGRVHFLRLVN